MEKRVIGDAFQKVTVEDFNELGEFTRDSLDTIVGKLLIPDIGFSGFTITQDTGTAVEVANGKLFSNGKVFFNDTDGGTTIDLSSRLPAATKRIVAITTWGTEQDSQLEPRTFLQDAETRATVARETATEHWRWANIGAVSGIEGPDPQQPIVAADVIAVGWVTLTTTGVESIIMNDEGMVPTLREEDNRLNALDVWRAAIGSILDTLRSDIVALYARLAGLAPLSLVRQIANDVAILKELQKLPDLYKSYGYDHFLATDETDLLHVDQLSKVEEGIRFPPAEGFDAQLGLLNPFDASVINSSNVLLPAWTHQSRIQNLGTTSEHSISQYQFQTVDMVQKFMARQVTRYGTPFTICSNQLYWDFMSGAVLRSNGAAPVSDLWYDFGAGVFRRGSETFVLESSFSFGTMPGSGYYGPVPYSALRLKQVWQDTVLEPYWERVVTNYSISGSVIAESFPNSQDGWLTAVEVYFSRVAATGNVDMLICETLNGAPVFNKVIARSTKLVADMKVSPAGAKKIPTRFLFQPTFLRKNRYAIVLVTGGNHYVWCIDNSNLVSGTLFHSEDGAFFFGEATKDLCFEVFFAKFAQNQTLTQLNSLTLSGGIAAIDINADTIIPDGCQLRYEVQVGGVWHALDNVDGGPSTVFSGLPPLLPFRVAFVGTDSVQPALGVASNSRVTTWRPRSDFRHISTAMLLPANTTNLQIDIRVEAWRGAPFHTYLCKLLVGAGFLTVVNPTTTVVEVAPDNPDARIFHFAWTGLTATSTFRIRQEGTTDNVLSTYHVAQRFFIDVDAI